MNNSCKEMNWADVFDRDAPFYDSYVKYFASGVCDRIPGAVDMNREAIFYVKDEYVCYVLSLLIDLAVSYHGSGFVETLALFVSGEDRDSLAKGMLCDCNIEYDKLANDLESIIASLSRTGDDDLAEQFMMFLKSVNSAIEG